jgi:hypothetical protein
VPLEHERPCHACEIRDRAYVRLGHTVDHVERIVGGVGDVEPLSAAVDRGMVEAAGLGAWREVNVSQQLEHDAPRLSAYRFSERQYA